MVERRIGLNPPFHRIANTVQVSDKCAFNSAFSQTQPTSVFRTERTLQQSRYVERRIRRLLSGPHHQTSDRNLSSQHNEQVRQPGGIRRPGAFRLACPPQVLYSPRQVRTDARALAPAEVSVSDGSNAANSDATSIKSWASKLGGGFLRVTSSGKFVPEVDGLRFLAISAVLTHHLMSTYLEFSKRFGPVTFPEAWERVTPLDPLIGVGFCGYFGVELFFTLSGFILALPFAAHYLQSAERPSLWNYYLRRVVRIEPPYALALLIAFAQGAVGRGWPLAIFLPHLLASMSYCHGVLYKSASLVLGVAWSLEIEVQFYLLAPLLTLVAFSMRSKASRRVMLLCATMLLSYCIEGKLGPRLQYTLLHYGSYFTAGFLLADYYLLDWQKRPSKWPIVWDFIVILMAAVMFALLLPISKMAGKCFFLLPLVTLVFFAAIFRSRYCRAALSAKPVVAIGGMCYSIYLIHPIALIFLKPYVEPLLQVNSPFYAAFLSYCAIALTNIAGASIAYYFLVEKPFMTLAAKLVRR